MHVHSVCRTVLRYQIAGHSALVVQAGTAASTRGRGEMNSFNCVRIEQGFIDVERWTWPPERKAFVGGIAERYAKSVDGWLCEAGKPAD